MLADVLVRAWGRLVERERLGGGAFETPCDMLRLRPTVQVAGVNVIVHRLTRNVEPGVAASAGAGDVTPLA